MPTLQDYTTYTAGADSNSRIQNLLANSFDVVGIDRADDDVWLYKDFGAGAFGDLPLGILCDGQVDSGANRSAMIMLALSNQDGLPLQGHIDGDLGSYFLYFNITGGGTKLFVLQSFGGGGSPFDSMGWSFSARLFPKVTRSGTTTIANVYSTFARTAPSLIDTIIVENVATAFKNVYGFDSYNLAGGGAMTGDIANLDLLDFPDVGGQEVLMGGGLGDDETLMGGMGL